MASKKGPVATEAPTFSPTVSQPAIAADSVSVEALAAEATRATQSLKRQRESSPSSPSSALSGLHRELSPSKTARLIGLSSRYSPTPMTAAAAAEDERSSEEDQYKAQITGTSENPAFKAQSALMSASALAMSRSHDSPQDAPQDIPQEAMQDAPQDVPQDIPQGAPQDAPQDIPQDGSQGVSQGVSQDTPQGAPLSGDAQSAALPSVSIPHPETSDPKPKSENVSPQSATSLGSLGGASIGPVTTSPGPMELEGRDDRTSFGTQPPAPMDDKEATSLSYPGTLPPTSSMPAPPTRGMSMPVTPNQPTTPRSPNSKRHKCQYCETEFTRHHNLKSHLLTHSQEKPYVCQTCHLRFRRLHDLKRHTKLHTGEKPHVCPKCDRKFARGDALARHSKGPGGCVGRRSSLGSFLGEEEVDGSSHLEGDDSAMAGVVYNGSEGESTGHDRRQLGIPSIQAQHVQGPTGRLYPPNVDRGSGSSNASQTPGSSIPSLPMGASNPAMYAQSTMTESPKPLSPSGIQGHDSANINRQRSPSLTVQLQHFARHQTDRHTPPVPGFPPTDAVRYAASAANVQNPITIPPVSGSSSQSIVANTGPDHSRTSSGHGQNGSGDSSSNNIFATDQGIWAYIHSLEEQVRHLNDRVQALEATERSHEEKITYLADEMTVLRGQVEIKADPTAVDKSN
ncbi:hypothetical protein GGS23DRAFT_575026 [Durotheca rogersii]|uniref:uncharacterized protein n=1 Tax=Durotheca rogersii TaxID=419775 RepID=UPI00221ED3A5|nr:uncharacterized protein GGS23DRAFT_575026 [Durotheca rogersii]KAI5861816.1 hypothetical protein GGS23DRAFT_575026 [Durotheca rogersii]